MQNSEHLNDLFAALSALQGKLTNSPRAKQGHGYKYAELGAILDDVRPLLAVNGLAVVQLPAPADHGHVAVETIITHSSGQWLSETATIPVLDDNKRMNAVQACGSSYTYLRRYALAAALGIAQEDTDAASPRQDAPQRNAETPDAPYMRDRNAQPGQTYANDDGRKMTSRFGGNPCRICGEEITKGVEIYYRGSDKTAAHAECVESPPPAGDAAEPEHVTQVGPDDDSLPF